MDNSKIGKLILNKRLEKGLTQNELGDKLFVSGKAVSKWERGLSLPDIAILEKLADVLETDIYEILQIKKKRNIDLKKVVLEEKEKLKKKYRYKMLLFFIPIIIVFLLTLFKQIPFGYSVDHVRYTYYDNKLINLAKPKFSFYMKNKENSFSYKNFRGKYSLMGDVKNYLNSLEHISCNDTVYYYDSIADVTIIDYSVDSNFLYCNISYNVRNGNYCDTIKNKEYSNKLGGLGRYHTLVTDNKNMQVNLLLSVKEEENVYTYPASLYVYYCFDNGKKCETLERSSGIYEINKDNLIYYRNNIESNIEDLEIPTASSFVVRNKKLLLKSNYLSDYIDSVILK